MPHYHVTVEEIDQLLPQTQCGDCGYSGCLPYAKAIVNHNEAINKCPPGGVKTLIHLAEKLGQNADPLIEDMQHKAKKPQLAFIREEECIGCTKCIQACPVDAIIGTAKMMHTIITDECTGCELCIPACPVDCIDLIPLDHYTYNPEQARRRHLAKLKRQQEYADKQLLSTQRQHHLETTNTNELSKDIKQQSKKDLIKAALMRVNKKKKDFF